MLDQLPDLPPAQAIVAHSAEDAAASLPPAATQRPGSPVVIDILARPALPQDCKGREADPFAPEIIVCQNPALSPRLNKSIGPEADDFGNAIPRARVKLSETAEAEANLINKSLGGWNANGAEVRFRIDF